MIRVLEVVLYVGLGGLCGGVVGTSNLHYIGHNSVKNKGSIPLQVFFSWCVYYEKSCSSKLHYLTTKISKKLIYNYCVTIPLKI